MTFRIMANSHNDSTFFKYKENLIRPKQKLGMLEVNRPGETDFCFTGQKIIAFVIFSSFFLIFHQNADHDYHIMKS